MMRLFINALSASAGGGLTYVRNVLPCLAARSDLQITVVANLALKRELEGLGDIEFAGVDVVGVRRFWYEQRNLPELIRNSCADVLLCVGNFSLVQSPVPQVLLSRNSIYISPDFYKDLLDRREYLSWFDTQVRAFLAKRSVCWADATVAPSEAFASDLQKWTGRSILAIHHGFDLQAFVHDSTPLPPDIQRQLRAADGFLKILFVSHYNYYRNFETLIRALPILRDQLPERKVKLLLTSHLLPKANPGAYRPAGAARLIRDLGVGDMVSELGTIPYFQLHQLYAQADLYVTPAYAETFAHPLVEAMASGVPIIASDIPVHREICGEAALYFPKFSPDRLAELVMHSCLSPDETHRSTELGRKKSQNFSWRKHVEQLLEVCQKTIQLRKDRRGSE